MTKKKLETSTEEPVKPVLPEGEEKEERLTLETPEDPKTEERLQSPSSETLPSSETEEDYLRQYQYRKQTKFGSKDSDPQPGSKAELMKKKMLSSPRVRMMIPLLAGEDKTIPQSVTINGYRLDLPKQVYIEVPEQVANVLMDSLKQTDLALERNRISGNTAKENALL